MEDDGSIGISADERSWRDGIFSWTHFELHKEVMVRTGMSDPVRVHFALRPQKRDGLLGTGKGGEGDERVKTRPQIPPEKDRRDRGPPPEQWKCSGGVATSALRNCCFRCRAGQSHKDNVRCTAVEEQLEAKEVQLAQPSSTSLLLISSGQT